jgi:hypothetical protein
MFSENKYCFSKLTRVENLYFKNQGTLVEKGALVAVAQPRPK